MYCGRAHFIVNLDLMLKQKFLCSKRIRQINIRCPEGGGRPVLYVPLCGEILRPLTLTFAHDRVICSGLCRSLERVTTNNPRGRGENDAIVTSAPPRANFFWTYILSA